MRLAPSLIFTLVSCLAAVPALAQPLPLPQTGAPPAKPDAGKSDAGKPDAGKAASGPSTAELLKKGNEQCDHGELEDGLATLSAAWARKQEVETAIALANCEIKASEWAGAAEHLAFALRVVPESEGERRKALEKSFLAVRERVGAVKITVSVDGSDVFVGSRYAGQTPLPGEIYVLPGVTRITAKKPGFDEVEKSVKVEARGTQSISIDLSTETTRRTITGTRSTTPAWVLGGLGAVTAGVGGALFAAALSKGAAADALLDELGSCSPSKAGCNTLKALRQSHDTYFNAGTGVVIAGGALILVGMIYGVWASKSPTTGTDHASITVVPAPLAQGAGLFAQGRF